jgi:hypothetical protein
VATGGGIWTGHQGVGYTKALPVKNSADFGVSITGICKSANVESSASTVLKVKSDYAKWGKVIKDANIKAE